MYQAISMMEKNMPKAAISLFNKILKQDSKNVPALFNKGLALNQRKKNIVMQLHVLINY